jgi:hypothetical protein
MMLDEPEALEAGLVGEARLPRELLGRLLAIDSGQERRATLHSKLHQFPLRLPAL